MTEELRTPKRIQMSRQRPWRADNPDAVIVARPSKWGNPFKVGETVLLSSHGEPIGSMVLSDARLVVWLFRRYVEHYGLDLSDLRGHDLACWCDLDEPCHADVLLELANQVES